MARRHILTALAAALVLAAAAPSAAQATTCVRPLSKPSPASRANVVFDGIVLSGPRLDLTGDALSPARLQVLRYLKGNGPLVVRVATSFRQGLSGFGRIAGTFTPEPGEVYRINGRTPKGAGSSTARGVLEPGLCGGFRLERPDGWLHSVHGTIIRAQSGQGGAPWQAEPLRGSHGLVCIRFQPANLTGGADRESECASRLSTGRTLVGIATTSQGPSTTTAVVVAGTALRRVTIDSPDGPQHLKALGKSIPAAVAVLRGFVDPTDLEITATLAGGRTAEVELASRRADAPDPSGGPGWAVYGQASWPHVSSGICASFWQLVPRFRDIGGSPLTTSTCGTIRGRGYWFAVDTALATTAAGRTVVTGAVGSQVKGIALTARGTSYPVGIARFGRAFLAVLPHGVAASEITIAFRLANGTTATYTGRSALGTY